MSISQSKEFFINMKEKDIPKWNPKLSYYDQDPYVLEFFQNEWEKINKGVTIGGVFIHPWLYWHVNLFKSKIAQPDNSEPIMVPPLDDNAWYFAENYKEAEEKGKGLCMFGTRGFAKTVLEASVAHWTATIRYNGFMSINGGSAKDLKDVCQAIKLSNENIHHAFRLPILTEDWDKDVMFGFREANTSTFHSRLDIMNLEGGKEKASEKGAGGTPAGFIVDEIGKFDPRGLLQSALPKFKSQYGAKLVHILAGTSGNQELSEGAKYILENPHVYELLSMNWDRLDNSVPEEAITWKSSKNSSFGTFVPGQMSYRNGFEKKDSTLAEHVKIDNKDLKKIKMRVTDWENCTPFMQEEIKKLPEGDDKNKRIMYYPLKTEDCFITDSPNPFNVVRAQKKLLEIRSNPKYRLVDLSPEFGGKIKVSLSSKKLAEREYKGKDVDAPIMMFEEPDKDLRQHTNVAGLDDYKLTTAKESTSLGAMYVLQRKNVDINTPLEKILACVVERPHNSHNIFYEDCKILLKYYGASCNIEAIDTGFADYLETIGLNMMDFLCPNLNPAQDLTSANRKKKANSRFGTYPTPGNIKIMYETVIEYTNDVVTVDFDDNNEPIQLYGMDFIEDPFLLEEMIEFKYGGNFDRIVAFGWALILSRYLDKKNIQPKKQKTYSDEFYHRNSQKVKRTTNNMNFQNFGRVGFKNF